MDKKVKVIMLKRTKQIIIVAVILFLLPLTWQAFVGIKDAQGILPKAGKVSDVSVNLFFSLQPGGGDDSVVIDVIMMILATIIGAGVFIYLKNNNMFSAVQQRIGYKIFLKKGLTTTFFSGAALSLFTNLYQIGLINWFYYPFAFKTIPKELAPGPRSGYFSLNEFVDLSLYIILAAIGWGVFAVFIFSVGLHVRKTAFYIALGPILGLALVLLATLGNMNSVVWRTFAFTWFFYNLTAPGQYSFAGQAPPINSALAFLIAVFIYLAVAAVLTTLWYKHQRKLG